MAEPVAGADLGAAGFVAGLRRRGVAVTTGQALALVEGLAATGGTRAREVARATLATSPADVAVIDAALTPPTSSAPRDASRPGGTGGDREAFGDEQASDAPGRGRFSAVEVLRTRDLATCSDEERAEIRRLLASLRLVGPRRPARRWSPAGTHRSVDLRATARSAVRTSGELARLRHRARPDRRRRVVLLLDVSGSMAPYARTMLHLAYAGARSPGAVEVFALGTRLTRLTRHLSSRDADRALASAVAAAPDWGGGTRLAPNLRVLLDDPTTNGTVRGAVVVMMSDGLDRGDAEDLGRQTARLARLAHRLVWANPLRAAAGYQPTATGMAAALPHVDAFVDGHSLDAFEQLAEIVSRDTRPR
jgi:uncharacterized protein with von Willebrand factor type A (vWA) domain